MWGASEALGLLWRTLLAVVLLFLPCLAACTLAIRKGQHNATALRIIFLAALGSTGYSAFWLWFASPLLGRVCFFVLPFASFAVLYRLAARLDALGRYYVLAVTRDALLIVCVALLVLSVGFLFGGMDSPLHTEAVRFSDPLPGDNWLPYLFAQGVAHGHVPHPLSDTWLSSDRPPLQAGIFLSVFSFMPGKLSYAILGAICQSLWPLGLLVIKDCFAISRRAFLLASAVCLFSGFTFLNTFFVWPKLLAASYILPVLALLLSERGRTLVQTEPLTACGAAVLVAFALLAHGATFFALAGLIATMFAFRMPIPKGTVLQMMLVAIALYVPWILYQKFCDPPGDQLLKLHLAGVTELDNHSFGMDLMAAYSRLSWNQVLSNKLSNVRMVLGMNFVDEFRRDIIGLAGQSALDVASRLRTTVFFSLILNMGFLAIGLPALIAGVGKRCRTTEWRTAALIWSYIGITCLIWCVLMFGPQSTVLHQGTYAIVLLGYFASILALWNIQPVLAVTIAAAQAGFNWLLFVAFLPLTRIPGDQLRYSMLLLAAIGLCGIVYALISGTVYGAR